MRRDLIITVLALVISSCGAHTSFSITFAASGRDGQLFCAVHTGTGTVVVGLIDDFKTTDPDNPVPIIATGKPKQYVEKECDEVAPIVGGKDATPVPPPKPLSTTPVIDVAVKG